MIVLQFYGTVWKILKRKLMNCFKSLVVPRKAKFKANSRRFEWNIKFIWTKFNEYEKEGTEREQIINQALHWKCVSNEQYSGQNCLLVHGLVETDDEVTNSLVIEMTSTKMNTEVSPVDLYRTQRNRKKKDGQNKPRQIIVILSRQNVRKKLFSNKANPKWSNVRITESLTSKRKKILKNSRLEHGFTNVWTFDGKNLQ